MHPRTASHEHKTALPFYPKRKRNCTNRYHCYNIPLGRGDQATTERLMRGLLIHHMQTDMREFWLQSKSVFATIHQPENHNNLRHSDSVPDLYQECTDER